MQLQVYEGVARRHAEAEREMLAKMAGTTVEREDEARHAARARRAHEDEVMLLKAEQEAEQEGYFETQKVAFEGELAAKVQEMEDANVDDIRESVDAVYEQLNLGSSLQWSRQSSAADRVVAWRRIRKLTDPSTKSLLISIEKIRWGEERRVSEDRVRMGARQQQRIGGGSAG